MHARDVGDHAPRRADPALRHHSALPGAAVLDFSRDRHDEGEKARRAGIYVPVLRRGARVYESHHVRLQFALRFDR